VCSRVLSLSIFSSAECACVSLCAFNHTECGQAHTEVSSGNDRRKIRSHLWTFFLPLVSPVRESPRPHRTKENERFTRCGWLRFGKYISPKPWQTTDPDHTRESTTTSQLVVLLSWTPKVDRFALPPRLADQSLATKGFASNGSFVIILQAYLLGTRGERSTSSDH
jgi:hypothetical protein